METTTGMKQIVRNTLMPRSRWLISKASPSASPACNGATISTKRNVLIKAEMNTTSRTNR